MFDTMFVARKIKEARSAQNMTQMQLADEMEVSYQAVSNWERGNSMPDISKLEKICEVLHISLEELLGTEKQTEAVKKAMQKEDVSEENAMSLDELQGIAPLMPPKDLYQKILAEKINLEGANFEELVGLAPFLSEEALGQLLDRMLQHKEKVEIEDVVPLAPFLSKEKLNEIVKHQVDNGNWKLGDIHPLMPFI